MDVGIQRQVAEQTDQAGGPPVDNLRALGPFPWTRVVTVGTGEANNVRITDFNESPGGVTFTLGWRDEEPMAVAWNQPGLFNARNADSSARHIRRP